MRQSRVRLEASPGEPFEPGPFRRSLTFSRPTGWGFLALLVLSAPTASSCAATRRQQLERDVAERPPVAMTIDLRVDCEGDEARTFGPSLAWETELRSSFEGYLAVGSAVSTGGDEDSVADLVVRILIRPAVAGEPEVVPLGAVLDFVAWSTVPFLSLLVEDVVVDPAIDVEISIERRVDRELALRERRPIFLDRIPTSLEDRHPLLSWRVVSALLVPPFVFSRGDPDHVSRAISGDVMREVAARAAELVKNVAERDDSETIRSPRLARGSDGWIFSCQPARPLSMLLLRGANGREHVETLPLDADPSAPIEVVLPEGFTAPDDLVRVLAIAQETGRGATQHYTVKPAGRR